MNGQRSTQMSYFPLCQLVDFDPFTMADQSPYGTGYFFIPCKTTPQLGLSLITASTTCQDFGHVFDIPNGSILGPLFYDVMRVRTRNQQQQQQQQQQQPQPQPQSQRHLEPRRNPLSHNILAAFYWGYFTPATQLFPATSSHHPGHPTWSRFHCTPLMWNGPCFLGQAPTEFRNHGHGTLHPQKFSSSLEYWRICQFYILKMMRWKLKKSIPQNSQRFHFAVSTCFNWMTQFYH